MLVEVAAAIFEIKADMTDVEPKTEASENPPLSEADEAALSESDSVGDREEGDGEEQTVAGKPLDDDLDRRNPQYIPKGGAFYEHDTRTLDTEESEDAAEAEKKKKVWKESKTTERWLHDCYVEEEQAPKTAQELIDTYGYDIRNEENAPRARRRRKYGRGPDKYERKWDDESAYIASPKPGRGRGAVGGPRRRTGEDFPPLPHQNGEHVEREPVREGGRGRPSGGNTPWRGVPQSDMRSDHRQSDMRSDNRDRAPHAGDTRREHRGGARHGEARGDSRGDHRGGPRGAAPPFKTSPAAHQESPQSSKTQGPARPRMEDHIKPFRHDSGPQRSQESSNTSRGRPLEGRSPAVPSSNRDGRDMQDLSHSMAHMSVQQKPKPRDSRAREPPQMADRSQPVENPANRQNPKRYSSIRKGENTGPYFPPEDCPPLDPRDAEAAREMASASQSRPLVHHPQQRQQDVLVQSVNVMQRYPDSYNGNAAFLPGRTILQPIPQQGLSPQGPLPQNLSPQMAGMELPPPPSFVPPPMFIDMGQGEVVPFPSYTTYPQGQTTELYQATSGITYYSPEIQTGTGQPRALPQRRKAAIPIVPPPETR